MSGHSDDYLLGNRAAWVAMLHLCLRHLDYDNVEAWRTRWAKEREDAIAMLRRVCAEYGDNIWSPDTPLADVIKDHLYVYLEGELSRETKHSTRE